MSISIDVNLNISCFPDLKRFYKNVSISQTQGK